MRDAKSIVLVIVIVILIALAAFLTYMISNGQDPLVLLNTRATHTDDLLADPGNATNDPISGGESPTPTISYASTSSTPAPSGAVNPTMTPKMTATPTPTPTVAELPETGGGEPITPTPVEALPVAGSSDYINPAIIGGGILILLAMVL